MKKKSQVKTHQNDEPKNLTEINFKAEIDILKTKNKHDLNEYTKSLICKDKIIDEYK